MRFLVLLFLWVAVRAAGQPAARYDVVIHEIMADPAPAVGLPEGEYVELKNRSNREINLQGWRLMTGTATSGMAGAFLLKPDSLVILCSTAQAAAFAAFGDVLPVPGFPSLNNEGGMLSLVSKEGAVVHVVAYTAQWYRNQVKQQGGWSLEMMDAGFPCAGQSNWTASIASQGGTPGRRNSAAAHISDTDPPVVQQAFSTAANGLVLTFNEPVDSASVNNAMILLNPPVSIVAIRPFDLLYRQWHLQLAGPLDSSLLYNLWVQDIRDCSGNRMAPQTIRTGLPRRLIPSDLVINEILFYPQPNGHEYVEIYNRSRKVADLATLYLANKNSSGAAGSIKRLTTAPHYLLPGGYLVLTEDTATLFLQYRVQNKDAVLQMDDLPSLPNDAGTVVLMDVHGTIVDAVNYNSRWQFPLLADAQGVALERVDPEGPTQDPANWHSAAGSVQYGTPGAKNSQYRQLQATASFAISPVVFSPDNDGHDDFATFSYQTEEPGYVANVYIFSAQGNLMRHLVKNAVLGREGFWQWNGLDEQGKQVPQGPYVVLAEYFNLQGRKWQTRKAVVVAR